MSLTVRYHKIRQADSKRPKNAAQEFKNEQWIQFKESKGKEGNNRYRVEITQKTNVYKRKITKPTIGFWNRLVRLINA